MKLADQPTMKIADLFCGAGLAGVGYRRAGFDVIGFDVDRAALTANPGLTVWADVRDLTPSDFAGFDAIHASPPCQLHSTLKTGVTGHYLDLVDDTRRLVDATGLPYVIENVVGAPLVNFVTLCATSFGLRDDTTELRRHRLFETNWDVWAPPACQHSDRRVVGVYGDLANQDRPSTRGWKAGKQHARDLMGVDWPVTDRQLCEGIPPVYTEWIGTQLAGFHSSSVASHR